jgi:hypothetical protein
MVIVLLAVGYWISRDTHPLYRLIPTQQKYSVVLRDILTNRTELADSTVWDTLPPDIGSGHITEALRGELGLPEWMARNIIVDDCYISGNDLRTFGDVLCVTKMTRIGRLLEFLHWVTPKIRRDTAGGLGLRRLADGSLYYAVRGRILLISPSRDALVNALTLQQDDSLTAQAFQEAFTQQGGEDIGGTVTFATDDPLGGVLQDFHFRLWLDKTQAHLTWNAKLRTEQYDRLSPLLAGVSPRQLEAPPPGLLALSGDFNKPLREVWLALGPILGLEGEDSLFSQEKLAYWEAHVKEGPPSLPQLMAKILGPLGPEFRIALQSLDLSEWFPVPVFAGTFDPPQEGTGEFLVSLSSVPEGALPWESYPRYDADQGVLRIPMPAGPSLEPTLAPYGDSLLFCTSARVAGEMLAGDPALKPLEKKGNLYVRVRPAELVGTISDALDFLVRENVVRQNAIDDYHAFLAKWLYSAERISQVAGLFGYEEGEVRADIVVICPPQSQPTD